MDTQTTTAQRFTMDDTEAEEWLQRSVAAYEGGDYVATRRSSAGRHRERLGPCRSGQRD